MAVLQKYKLPLLLALLKFLLPFFLQNPFYELHRDEYLYLAESQHIAWGYMEVPPLLSIFAKISHLLGNGFFWVKCWPSLFGSLTVFVACLMVIEMGGKTFAQCIAALCLICGAYLRVHFLFQPNFLEIFWWTLIAYFMVKFINTQNSKWIIFVGLAAGMGWMSKYSVILFLAGVIVGLLLTTNRKLFLGKSIYWSALIAILIALPNVIWQYNHRWPVIFHMKELRETQLMYISPLDFLKDQLLMHLPVFFVWTGGLVWLLFFRAGKPYRILAWIYITVIVLLIASSGKNYYSLGAYPMLFAAGSVALESLTALKFKWIRYASIITILILLLPLIPVLLPVWKPVKLAAYYNKIGFDKVGVLKWEDLKDHPLPQDFADMLGWKELAAKLSLAYAALPDSSKSNTMIHCRNYGQAGAVTYYGKGLPQINTDNASFLFWMPDKYNVRNILLVANHPPGDDDIVFHQFEKYRVIDSIINPLAREYGTKIYLFENGNEKLNKLIEADVKEQKDAFRH